MIQLTPQLCRVSRAFLRWSIADLAERAGIGWSTLADYEREARAASPDTMRKLQCILERQGIILLEDGVRYRPRRPA